MYHKFKICDQTIEVDVQETINFYNTQKYTLEGCQCSDCAYFVNTFIHKPFEIFKIIKTMGVDLQKCIDKDEGVWCVRDNEKVIHVDHLYYSIGHFSDENLNQVIYHKIEENYGIQAVFFNSPHRANTLGIQIEMNIIDE